MARLVVRFLCGMLLALALCGSALASGTPKAAAAATTWQLIVGGNSKDNAVTVNAFLPTAITLNAGDTITWAFHGFHTVTFLSGTPRPAVEVPSGEDHLLMLNPTVFTPVGGPNYDGSGFVNSGPPNQTTRSFSLTFTKAGTYPYVCLIHAGMAGQVVVQAKGGAYPMTQAQVDAAGNAEFYSKLEQGANLIANAHLTSQPGANGTTNYTALAGAGGNQVSLLRFLPGEITLKAGDSITWVMNDPHEIHTVTFYDAAGKPPMFSEPRPQANGPPKLIIPHSVPENDTAVDSHDLYNSGILTPGTSYTFTFPKPGTYTYICAVHGPNMTGKVIVEAAGAPTPSTLPKTADGMPTAPLLGLVGAAMLLVALGALLVRRRA